jgi:hypothetical protein
MGGFNGAMMRLFIRSTNLGTVTWPGYVVWPGGIVPNLASGPRKEALVTLFQLDQSGVVIGVATMF